MISAAPRKGIIRGIVRARYFRGARDPVRHGELRVRGLEGDRVPRAIPRRVVQGRVPARVRAVPALCAPSSSTFRSTGRPRRRSWRATRRRCPRAFRSSRRCGKRSRCRDFRSCPGTASGPASENPRYLDARAFREEVLPAYESAFRGHTGPFIFEFPTEWQPTPAGAPGFPREARRVSRETCRRPTATPSRSARPRTSRPTISTSCAGGAPPTSSTGGRGLRALLEQWEVAQPLPASFSVTRILVPPGVPYEQAVERFRPTTGSRPLAKTCAATSCG